MSSSGTGGLSSTVVGSQFESLGALCNRMFGMHSPALPRRAGVLDPQRPSAKDRCQDKVLPAVYLWYQKVCCPRYCRLDFLKGISHSRFGQISLRKMINRSYRRQQTFWHHKYVPIRQTLRGRSSVSGHSYFIRFVYFLGSWRDIAVSCCMAGWSISQSVSHQLSDILNWMTYIKVLNWMT